MNPLLLVTQAVESDDRASLNRCLNWCADYVTREGTIPSPRAFAVESRLETLASGGLAPAPTAGAKILNHSS